MIRHYLIIALRVIERQKLSAFINLIGLSIGLACFSLFVLYAVNEFSYDRFHSQGKDIYRVYEWWKFTERQGAEPSSATPIGPAMKNDLTDVADFVRIQGGGERLVRVDSKTLAAGFTLADPQILTVFTFPLIHGDPSKALKDPNNIVITESTALQFFGDTNVIGKPIEIREEGEFKSFVVSAVAKDVPVNSSIRFDMLGTFDRTLNTPLGRESSNSFTMTLGILVYVQLRPGSNLANDPLKLASFRQKYFPDETTSLIKDGKWDGKGMIPVGYGLQPLSNVHTDIAVDMGASDPKNAWTLVAIAGGVLMIACINFIILSIGRSASRSKEVGVRKISGGRKKQLIFQFVSESMLLTVASALIGAGLAQVLLPYFNELSGRQLTFSLHLYPELILWMMAVVIVVGLLAGSYPALVLSGLKPVEVLKKRIRLAGSNFFTRSLVTFQFSISVTLIIVMIVVLQQLSFMQAKDLGFKKEQVVMIDAQGTKTYRKFRRQLESQSGIEGITASMIGMGDGEGQMGRAYLFQEKREGVIEYPVDANFLDVMGMTLIAGRNFNDALTSDSLTSVIVNESLVSLLLNTTPQQAIGMQLKPAREGETSKTIIGVVRDFHYEPLRRNVRPQLFIHPADLQASTFFVRLESTNQESMKLLSSAWKGAVDDLPFKYSFIDQKFDQFYQSEERWASIVAWAGNICIFLACLGLFGLASVAAVNRTKEIGIRKTMGASVESLVRLLCTEFVMLVLIGVAIASPVAWYVMDKWLMQFAYRVELTWLMFIMAGASALLVATLTVGVQAMKAALSDPVNALRSE
jgi:putative ABC transport system permease protein